MQRLRVRLLHGFESVLELDKGLRSEVTTIIDSETAALAGTGRQARVKSSEPLWYYPSKKNSDWTTNKP